MRTRYYICSKNKMFSGEWCEPLDGPIADYMKPEHLGMEWEVTEIHATPVYGEYETYYNNIRYRTVTQWDPEKRDNVVQWEFEVYGLPYFFGLLRKRKWVWQITTNNCIAGLHFCIHLIAGKRMPVP